VLDALKQAGQLSGHRGSFDTVRALTRHIAAYIAKWNSHPTPFVWTKDPAVIARRPWAAVVT
jgi:hypothetical protein